MILKSEYEAALRIIKTYTKQNNAFLKYKSVHSNHEFEGVLPVKHKADLTVGDIVLIAKDEHSGSLDFENFLYEQVECTAYCGRDEFWGKTAKGDKRYWLNASRFKIVGQTTTIKQDINPLMIEA